MVRLETHTLKAKLFYASYRVSMYFSIFSPQFLSAPTSVELRGWGCCLFLGELYKGREREYRMRLGQGDQNAQLNQGTQGREVPAASSMVNLLGSWDCFINLLKLMFFTNQYFISVLPVIFQIFLPFSLTSVINTFKIQQQAVD